MKAKKPFVLSAFGRKCATPQGLMVLQQICVVSLIALIALCIAWEGKLAPLKPGGSLLLEIGWKQDDAVRSILAERPELELGPTLKDMGKNPRVVTAKKK